MTLMEDLGADIPAGWIKITVGAISESIQYGYTASATPNVLGPRFLRITDIQEGMVDWNTVPSCKIDDIDFTKYKLYPGDIVFARTGATTGKSFLIATCPEAVFASYLIRLQPRPNVIPKFLWLFFQTSDYWKAISENVAGNAQPGCNASKLGTITLPLPPLAEQKRIVAKVEQLLARVNVARERLAKVPAMLKRFRQSVLASACSGQLTADWRDNQDFVSSRTSLKQLATAGIKEYESLCVKAKRSGERRPKQPVYLQESVEDHDDLPELSELPDQWTWTTIHKVALSLQYGTSVKADAPAETGVPMLRMSNIQEGTIDYTDLKYMTKETNDWQDFLLDHGDIVFNRTNSPELVGKAAVFNVTRELVFASYLVRLACDTRAALPSFVCYWINSPWGREWARTVRTDGVSQSNINATKLAAMPLPLPPVAEQVEILRRVEKLFALADKIEAKVQAATARVEKITQSILAKAFRGELVPTEAELARQEGRDYEPASVLLERIKAAGASATEKLAKRTRRKQVEPVAAAEAQPFTLEPVAETKPTEPQRKLPKGIFFTRGAVASYIVEKMHKLPSFGRVELEKCLYLTETLVGIDLAGQYGRRAAGPLDNAIYKLESVAKKQGWFTSRQSQYNMIRYAPGQKIADRLRPAKTILGDKQKVMDQLLAAIAKMDTERAELFATVYAAWNDFLLDGKTPSDDQLVTEVREHWHEAKQRFTPERIQKCIKWIRDQGFTPRGTGPHTYIIPKDERTKPKTRKKVPTQRRLEWDAA